jgi:AT-rich interactive domain-containing protein 1
MGPPSTMPMPPQQPFPPSGGGPGMMMMPHQMIMRKEITFPPGSVEATQPILVKRRKITARDISQIEAWRILMSLKSGLLAESTWALDVLTVLAYDDSTFGCFVLSGMPGLLDTLLEHYRKCLSQLFHGLLSDRKDSHPKKIHDKSLEEEGEEFVQEGERSLSGNLCRFRIRKSTSSKNKKWYEIDDDIKENSESVALLEVESVNPCDHYSSSLSINSLSNHSRNSSSSLQSPSSLSSPVKQESNRTSNDLGAKHKLTNNNQSHIPLTKAFPLQETQIDEREQELQVLLNGPFNFTNRSRDGKPVKIIESKDDLSICDLEKKWSRLRNPLLFDEDSLTNDSGIDQDWDESQHILTQFAPKHKTVRFVRVMKSSNEDIPVQENKSEEKCLIHQEEDKSLQKVIKNHVIQSESKKQEENEGSEVTVDSNEKYPRFREPRKRKHDLFDDFEEEEAYQKDHPSLYPVEEYAEGLSRRCLVLSTLIRNLSFVSGNENELARHEGVMRVLSRLLLLNHEHPAKSKTCMKQPPVIDETTDESLFNEEVTKEEEKLEEDDNEELDLGSDEWYWDAINTLLENTLVTLANVSGQIDLSPFPEDVSLPLLDGLLHWAVCPSSFAQDHLPMTSITNLSPQRLALETLVKLSIREGNVDLMLATPPWERLDRLFKTLSKKLARNEDQTLREFALVMLVNMSTADTSIARAVALTGNAIPQLISFVEQSEQSAMSVAQSHGVNALRENPEMMGTTLDMVRRAALCLRALSRIPDNRPLFSIYQQRLLNLVMSQILDQGVAAIMADVMYECSLSDPILHTSRETFLTYITPIVGESHVVTSRPLTPPAPASSAASMVSGDHHHHNMINSKDSSGNHEVRSHAALVNSNHSNGSLSASQLITNGPVGSPLLNNTSKSVLPELLKREITSSPVPLKAVSPVIMNGCMDSPTSNHLDSLHNHDRNKIELSKVPPPVKMDNSLKAIETTPVVAVNNHDNSVKNNGTNTDKGCPRLKELLLSYQMSPKFDGHDSPTQPPQEQITS